MAKPKDKIELEQMTAIYSQEDDTCQATVYGYRLGICVVRLTTNFKIKYDTSLAYNIYTLL